MWPKASLSVRVAWERLALSIEIEESPTMVLRMLKAAGAVRMDLTALMQYNGLVRTAREMKEETMLPRPRRRTKS